MGTREGGMISEWKEPYNSKEVRVDTLRELVVKTLANIKDNLYLKYMKAHTLNTFLVFKMPMDSNVLLLLLTNT